MKNSRKADKYRGANCLNCGHPMELTDRYCSYCSQLNTTKPLTLTDFFGEFIGSIITYDSKFRYTLRDLLFKPGTISRNFVDGKRLQYANPFRFFLSVSIIYFIVQGLIATFSGESNLININEDNAPNLEGVKIVPDGNNNFRIVPKSPKDSAAVDSVLRTAFGQVDSVFKVNNIPVNRKMEDLKMDSVNLGEIDLGFDPFGISNDSTYTYYSEAQLDTMSFIERNFKRIWLYRAFYRQTGIGSSIQALDSLKHENTAYHRWVYDKNDALERIEEKPGEFATYLLEKTPFFVFFFSPVFALCFWLIYSKKKHTYMAHLVFVFHIFSFVFLAMLTSIVPDMLIGFDLFSGLLFGLIGPFYFYKALRNFYKQNRLITILKFIFLNWVFWIGATIAAILFFAVTAAFY